MECPESKPGTLCARQVPYSLPLPLPLPLVAVVLMEIPYLVSSLKVGSTSCMQFSALMDWGEDRDMGITFLVVLAQGKLGAVLAGVHWMLSQILTWVAFLAVVPHCFQQCLQGAACFACGAHTYQTMSWWLHSLLLPANCRTIQSCKAAPFCIRPWRRNFDLGCSHIEKISFVNIFLGETQYCYSYSYSSWHDSQELLSVVLEVH